MIEERLILALDGLDEETAVRLTAEIGQFAYAVKVHDLVHKEGTGVIRRLKLAGAERVWVDFKFHDIPKTVRRSAKALHDHGADIITVHASGGKDMVAAAVDSGAEIFVITVLTSLTPGEIEGIYGCSPEAAVQYLAGIGMAGGAAGFVCSPLEVASLRGLDQKFKRVVPGSRSIGVAAGDQKRVATPAATLAAGAHHLVIASQVTEAADPLAAWQKLVDEIAAAQV